MKTGRSIIRKIMAVIFSVIVIAAMCPVCVLAAGNDYKSAAVAVIGSSYSGTLSNDSKEHWYKVTLPGPGYLSVSTQTGMDLIEYSLWYADDASKKVFDDFPVRLSSDKSLEKTYDCVLTGGTYYFAVKWVRGSGSYSFKMSFSPANDSFNESYNRNNDSIGNANAISFNTAYKGFFALNDDADYHKIEVTSDKKITVSVTSKLDILILAVYDSAGKTLRFPDYPTKSVNADQITASYSYELQKGTYYIAFQRFANYGGFLGSYEFTVLTDSSSWQHDSKGWWYRNSDGSYPANEWKQISGKWYFFDASGDMVTGWKQIGGYWYHFDKDGVMQTGWVSDGGKWYYFNGSGVMQTGWITVGGKWYYLKSSGAMAANEYCGGYWLNDDGTWTYTYKASWRKNSTGWWYGDNSGWYAKNQTLKIDDKNYNFNANGYCTNP